jgi:hypothetical protein
MLWKLRGMIRDRSNMTPDESNIAERTEGVKRANLPNPNDYDDTLKAMSACETCELGLDELHEAACALYIRKKKNQAVVDSFQGDEYVGSKRNDTMKARMKTSVKEVIKNSVNAKAAVGLTSGTFGKKTAKKHKGGGVAAAWKHFSAAGSSLPP